MASLAGRAFPSIWSCGRDWSRARTALLDMRGSALTKSTDNGRHLINRLLVDERTPQTQIFQLSEKALNSVQAGWQRLVIGALAMLLLILNDTVDGQPCQAHAQLFHGVWAGLRLRRTLGRLATQDWLCGDAGAALCASSACFAEGSRRQWRSTAASPEQLPAESHQLPARSAVFALSLRNSRSLTAMMRNSAEHASASDNLP